MSLVLASISNNNACAPFEDPDQPGSASMAQSDMRPTGNKEVAGSIPTESCNSLSWRLIMKYFLRSFSPFG